jgi:beta-lactamase class A
LRKKNHINAFCKRKISIWGTKSLRNLGKNTLGSTQDLWIFSHQKLLGMLSMIKKEAPSMPDYLFFASKPFRSRAAILCGFSAIAIFATLPSLSMPLVQAEVTPCECSATTVSLDFQITTETVEFSPGTLGELQRVVAGHRGRMGISVRNLDTGEVLEVNGQAAFPAASVIKVPVMMAAMDKIGVPNGPFPSYYDKMTYTSASLASGSGSIQNYRDGTEIQVKELIHQMIITSDNVATNMITEALGGPGAVSRWLVDHGFKVTRMNATIGGKMVDDPDLRRDWGIGVTTPCEMRLMFERLVLGTIGTPATRDEMLRILGQQYWDDLLGAHVPPMVWAGLKSGALRRSRSDAGIIASPGGIYAVAVFTSENLDTSWSETNEAEANIREVSRILWKHFNPSHPYDPPAGSENFR